MSAITEKEIIANHAENRFNSIKMGIYMTDKVHTLIENILTTEFQPKKQIFECFAKYFEGHTPAYILNELENAGIVEKQVRAEGTVRIHYVETLGLCESKILCENGIAHIMDGRKKIDLELSTLTISEPYSGTDWRCFDGYRLIPKHVAYYRLKGC